MAPPSSAPVAPPVAAPPVAPPGSEAERPTELGLEPIRATTPPPSIRNPAPLAPPNPIQPPNATMMPRPASPPVAPSPAPSPAPVLGSNIGQIPDDDDDAVPIRNHGAAREVISAPESSGSTGTGRITDVQTQAPGSRPTTPPPTEAPVHDPTDFHERPTVIDTGGRGPRRPRAHTPWNPPLQGFNADPTPLSPEAFAQVVPKLEATLDRDAVTAVLLDFLGAGFNRVILFVHSHNELRGLDARGKDLLVEAVRQVRIPSTGKSMFSEVLERGGPYFGPLKTNNKIDQAFAQALGGVRGNVLLLPIKVGRKVPLLLWAHGTTHPVDPHSIAELSNAVSEAIQRIIAAARSR